MILNQLKTKRERYNVSRSRVIRPIKKSNNDINTVVGEVVKNYQLDKTKALIARALYNNKKILILMKQPTI